MRRDPPAPPKGGSRSAVILTVEDEPGLQHLYRTLFVPRGWTVLPAPTLAEAEGLLNENPDVVILDIALPDGPGTDLIRKTRENPDPPEVIMATADASISRVVGAMREGAFDYIVKPFEPDELIIVIERALEARSLKKRSRALESLLAAPPLASSSMLAEDSKSRVLLAELARVAASSLPALISGETGTGKEVAASEIHRRGPFASKPFIVLHCPALPASLIESELFGHARGAFTGAYVSHEGIIEAAEGGTILLDEITEIEPIMQTKLLRFIETGEYRRIGETRARHASVRVLATTNRDPETAIREGKFREDLFYRVAGLRVHVPSLRERPGDIVPLAVKFLEVVSRRDGKRLVLTPGAEERLKSHSWPGNVRELRSAVDRLSLFCDGPEITAHDLDFLAGAVSARPAAGGKRPGAAGKSLEEKEPVDITTLDDLCRLHAARSLERHNGNKTAAARELGISTRTLYRMLEEE